MMTQDIFHPPKPSEQAQHFQHLVGSSLSLALTQILREARNPVLIIAPDSLTAARLTDELHFFGGGLNPVLPFPDWETLPYDHFSPHQDIISERLTALNKIPRLKTGGILATPATLLQRLPPCDYTEANSFLLKKGDQVNLETLRQQLTRAGYQVASQVREHGEFAIRGSLLDLFPMGSKTPFRIDLFDDEVESIRLFSVDTQLSTEPVESIHLLPAKEFPLTETGIDTFRQAWRDAFSGDPLHCPIYQDISEGIPSPGIEYYLPLFFSETASLFAYLPKNTLIICIGDTEAKLQEQWQEILSRFEIGRHDRSRPLLPPMQAFFAPEWVKTEFTRFNQMTFNDPKQTSTIEFGISSTPNVAGLPALQQFIAENKGRVLFAVESLGRREVVLKLTQLVGITLTPYTNWEQFIEAHATYGVVVAPLDEGFQLHTPPLTVITESQLYGKRVMQRRLRKKTAATDPEAIIRDLTELQIGDPVVHIDHGVGRYLGLQTITVADQIGEFLTLEYQGGDKLYIPVAALHLISRYTGADIEHTPIHKLGNDVWSRLKRKAAEKARDVAAELLDLYAKRAAREGFTYELPQDQYETFTASFPFEETPDQLNAIQNVFNDMASSKAMDRVVCGDVGFGKTEVALRAAFLAVQNNKQVAVLVPTTLLAQQHFENFRNRFADWPVQVEVLSRFRTAKEQKQVLARLQEGKVDIVIGTHKLIQSDLKFKALGLVIIDEEHRFGVKQKEQLKALRASVDILTLTATPIPRTLNMALAGIRDLSIIATPPARRLSVKTFVHEYQEGIIQEAIQRELLRGGQVYFLHNDVATINKKADEIAKLVREARTSVAHGQMHERELEQVMAAFYHRQTNVLVCSTIIESGIDIPTANTIIINRADKLGLAQLHQLRGRVGRSHHQAYAYLLTPPRQSLTADASKRLDAIANLGDLGVGFTLSTHDLEIRGAGELLGEGQSGNMHEVGYSLYMDLLSRAVQAIKDGVEPNFDEALSIKRTEVDLHLTALIPADYLGDIQLRLQFYKRLASTKSERELDDIQVELIDRFGLMPDALKQLVANMELKQLAEPLGILKLDVNDKGGKIDFTTAPQVKPETIIRLLQAKNSPYRLDGPTRLRFTLPSHEAGMRTELVRKILQELST